MSAHIVTPETIRALVSWGKSFGVYAEVDGIAEKFIEANVKSIASRYPDTVGKEIRSFTFLTPGEYLSKAIAFDPGDALRAPVEVIKLCHCLAYQSCEYDGWTRSSARVILRAIEKEAIRRLPGYEDAPWGLEAEENAVRV